MYISDIKHWDKRDKEADVIVTDGQYQLLCYANPVQSIQCREQVAGLFSFGCENIVKSEHCAVNIVKQTDYYAYELSAEVLSKVEGTVKMGQLVLQLDAPVPGDVQTGDYVTFKVQRIDATTEKSGGQ